MAYNIKRGGDQSSFKNSLVDALLVFLKRLMITFIIMTLIAGLAYIGLLLAYHNIPVFAEAADDVMAWISEFYNDYGLWATLGLILFVCAAVWALGEETKKRERRREMTRDMMR